jgi:hypothetical protein
MAEQPRDPILRAFDAMFACEQHQMDSARAEIRERGTYWAGGELYRLRRQVEYWRKQATDLQAKYEPAASRT